ncbi:hypothetical protein [Clostridium akagii]|uniref:hypothetical protein n=1 Tax=Clostridium akagii TaxID=91623 RepID=UPI000478C39D|nr:hypothetical protein [Clostridium akagii]
MKIELKKNTPIIIAIIIASIFTIVFSSLTISNSNSNSNSNSYVFRILTQGSLCLIMLLSGLNSFSYQKQRVLGFFMCIVSAFLLFVMISTIIKSAGI